MAFVQRLINVTFNLASGQNPFPGGGNQLNLSGLRCSAKINKVLAFGQGQLFMQIWGMALSEMNHLATLGIRIKLIPNNTITVMAGDAGAGALPMVFYGTVMQAWIDASRAPDVSFNIEALTLAANAAAIGNVISQKGQQDGAQVMEQIAGVMGCDFDNSAGASFTLFNPYFWGSPRSQADQCAKACGFTWCVDDKTLRIAPKGKGAPGTVIVSPNLGNVVGYPSFAEAAIKLKVPFNPNFRLQQKFTVQDSQFKGANGNAWIVQSVDHDIEAMLPGGNWFTIVEAWNENTGSTAPTLSGLAATP